MEGWSSLPVQLGAAGHPGGQRALSEEARLHGRNVPGKTRGALAEDKEVFTHISSPYVWL